jgi:pyruvate formate lyase activating enzyme
MHKELPKFLAKLKERGLMVKLDTNGCFPDILQESLPCLDYVAMDVKTSTEKYKLLGTADTTNVMRSIALLKAGKVPYEFRTTVCPEIVTEKDITAIGEMINGSKTIALQQFVPNDTLDKRFRTVKPYTLEKLQEFADTLKKYADVVLLRL